MPVPLYKRAHRLGMYHCKRVAWVSRSITQRSHIRTLSKTQSSKEDVDVNEARKTC